MCPDAALTIGNYTYLDGRYTCSCPASMLSWTYDAREALPCSPSCALTDVHPIKKEAHDAAARNFARAPFWQKIIRLLTGGARLVNNALKPISVKGGDDIHIVDGIVVAQGPNYALAKRLQHWRAIVARSKGHTVSTNIAPSTATKSVVHASTFAAAYKGMFLFKPIEIMFQETSGPVMNALLLHDLRNPQSAAQGGSASEYPHPMHLFTAGSFHGGVWRMAFKMNSIAEVSAVCGYAQMHGASAVAAAAIITGLTRYVLYGSVM